MKMRMIQTCLEEEKEKDDHNSLALLHKKDLCLIQVSKKDTVATFPITWKRAELFFMVFGNSLKLCDEVLTNQLNRN